MTDLLNTPHLYSSVGYIVFVLWMINAIRAKTTNYMYVCTIILNLWLILSIAITYINFIIIPLLK